MIRRIRLFLVISLAMFLLTLPAKASGHLSYFTANLDDEQIVNNNNFDKENFHGSSGFGRVTFDENTSTITVSIYYEGLTSGVTDMHIHGPAAAGSNGPHIIHLNPTVGQTSGSVVNFQTQITNEQITFLRNELLYFNIHTSNHPHGEIRGQILIDSPFVSSLKNLDGNLTGNTSGGSGMISLNSNESQALVSINWENLSAEVNAGHIHDSNGSVVCNFHPPQTASGSVQDVLCDLNLQEVDELKRGQFHIKLHTPKHPHGELKGQILSRNSKNIDFEGDTKTDISIFRPNTGEWWYQMSSDRSVHTTSFGLAKDKMVPADYTGDGITDIAIWRESKGAFFILHSEDSSVEALFLGTNGDIPVPADFDADGVDDTAIYRPATGTWFINYSSNQRQIIKRFGYAEDIPVVKDYDGDGSADVGIYRPSNSQWWIDQSSDGLIVYQFGTDGDKPVANDFTGDGKADIAVWREATGEWFILRSDDTSFYSFPFGLNGDIATAADYDGDGKTDPAIYRPSEHNWYLLQSQDGFKVSTFGTNNDIPIPSTSTP